MSKKPVMYGVINWNAAFRSLIFPSLSKQFTDIYLHKIL